MKEVDVILTKFGPAKCQLCPGRRQKKCVQSTVEGKTGVYCLPHLEIVLLMTYGIDEPETPILDAVETGKYAAKVS